jgi:hypothetical protein
MIDRKTFFDHVRAEPFGGFLSGSQVTGLAYILDEAERRGPSDPRFLAYRLATTFHETREAMIPVREAGGEAYLKAKPYYPWVGMGLVQVTWEANGKKFGATKPEDLMSWPVALRALFDGMDQGVFTGRKLATYFSATVNDPVGARHIINGSDKASLIAGYHAQFLAAIKAAGFSAPSSATPVLASIETAINDAAKAQGAVAGVAVPKTAVPVIPPVTAPPHLLPQPAKPGFWASLVAAFSPKKV